MTFTEAYRIADSLFKSKEWFQGGVEQAGETERVWLFKSRHIKTDALSPTTLVINKEDGSYHVFHISNYDDRKEAYTAKLIDVQRRLREEYEKAN